MNKEQKKIFFVILYSVSFIFLFIGLGALAINYQSSKLLLNNNLDDNYIDMLSFIVDSSLGLILLVIVAIIGLVISFFKRNKIIDLVNLSLSSIIVIASLLITFISPLSSLKENSSEYSEGVLSLANAYGANLLQISLPLVLIIVSNIYLYFANKEKY